MAGHFYSEKVRVRRGYSRTSSKQIVIVRKYQKRDEHPTGIFRHVHQFLAQPRYPRTKNSVAISLAIKNRRSIQRENHIQAIRDRATRIASECRHSPHFAEAESPVVIDLLAIRR